KMKDGYGDGDITIHPTQIFIVNNWALKPNHTKGPPFTAHMLSIYNAEKPLAFKGPRTFSQIEKKVSQGTKLGAKLDIRSNQILPNNLLCPAVRQQKVGLLKHPSVSKLAPIGKEKSPARPRTQTQASLQFLHLGTSEEGAYLQLSSGMPAFSNLKLIYSVSVIIHFESALGYDASINSIAKADPGTSAPNDSLPPQQGKDEGTKNYSLDHIFAGTDLNVLADKTKSVSDGLETVLTTPKTGTQNAKKPSEEIKLENLAKLVPNVKADFKDLDSPEDDPIVVVDDSEEDEEENKRQE
ncbi:hypothetical protein Tco_0864653, partial [Tanacetum coccineum]